MVSDLTVISASSDIRPFASDEIFYPQSTSPLTFSPAVDRKLFLTLDDKEKITYVSLSVTLPAGSTITVDYLSGNFIVQVSLKKKLWPKFVLNTLPLSEFIEKPLIYVNLNIYTHQQFYHVKWSCNLSSFFFCEINVKCYYIREIIYYTFYEDLVNILRLEITVSQIPISSKIYIPTFI